MVFSVLHNATVNTVTNLIDVLSNAVNKYRSCRWHLKPRTEYLRLQYERFSSKNSRSELNEAGKKNEAFLIWVPVHSGIKQIGLPTYQEECQWPRNILFYR